MSFRILLSICMTALAAQSAFAVIQEDQISGEVLRVMAGERKVEVAIKEVGEDLKALPGTTETYHIPRSVPIEYEIETVAYRTDPNFTFSDIKPGDKIVLDFDMVSDQTTVRRVRNVETKDTTVRERIRTANLTVEEEPDFDSDVDVDVDAEADLDEGRFAADVDVDADEDEFGYDDDRLPDSASGLPLYALLGLVFAGMALTLRMRS